MSVLMRTTVAEPVSFVKRRSNLVDLGALVLIDIPDVIVLVTNLNKPKGLPVADDGSDELMEVISSVRDNFNFIALGENLRLVAHLNLLFCAVENTIAEVDLFVKRWSSGLLEETMSTFFIIPDEIPRCRHIFLAHE
jgi:hypothetical protein